jgi:hypothetical protein
MYNDRFSGFLIFSLNVGEAMLPDCGRPFHSTLSLVSVMGGHGLVNEDRLAISDYGNCSRIAYRLF